MEGKDVMGCAKFLEKKGQRIQGQGHLFQIDNSMGKVLS